MESLALISVWKYRPFTLLTRINHLQFAWVLFFYRSTNPNQTKPNYFHVVCVFSLQSILGHMLDLKSIPSRKLTYPRDKVYLKMIFLFPRWDMLVPWRVNQHLGELDFQHPTFWTQGQLLVSHRNGNSWLLWMEKKRGLGCGKEGWLEGGSPPKIADFFCEVCGVFYFFLIFGPLNLLYLLGRIYLLGICCLIGTRV